MCGVAAVVAKSPGVEVGSRLTDMLQALHRRGPDSTGMALYRPPSGQDLAWLTLSLAPDVAADGQLSVDRARERLAGLCEVLDLERPALGSVRLGVRLPSRDPEALRALVHEIEQSWDGVTVFSLGERLDLYKDVLDPNGLRDEFALGEQTYTHGIGHVRLATESRVDVAHSHPFWARPFPEVALVHNGHITNYHKLRRIYEQHGFTFTTGNDSEFVAVYLAGKLYEGATLDEAADQSVRDLDGSFTYLVGSEAGVAVARDRFGSKPCVVAESDDWVAIASEEVAVRAAFGDEEYDVKELAAGETRAWQL